MTDTKISVYVGRHQGGTKFYDGILVEDESGSSVIFAYGPLVEGTSEPARRTLWHGDFGAPQHAERQLQKKLKEKTRGGYDFSIVKVYDRTNSDIPDDLCSVLETTEHGRVVSRAILAYQAPNLTKFDSSFSASSELPIPELLGDFS
jgi:hypothetical protein